MAPGLRKAALRVVQKLPAVNDVVGAVVVVDPECPAAALGHPQVVKGVAGASGAGGKPPPGAAPPARLRHEDSIVPAVANRHSLKHVVTRLPHKDAHVVAIENRALDDIMVTYTHTEVPA